MKLQVYLKIYFFYILLFNSFFIYNQKEYYDYEDLTYLSTNVSFLNDFNLNYQIDSDIEPKNVYKTLKKGEVQTELIYNEEIYIFNFSESDYNDNNDNNDNVIVHFYPLDCHIKIVGHNNEGNIDIKPISNYEYDSFYAIIEKNLLKSSIFKIKTLINSIEDYSRNRTFHLIINSFENNTNSNLNINDNEPILLNFNDNLESINLVYNLRTKIDYPILVSFFIKERVKFLITISSSSNEKNKIKKIIAYTDKILIDKASIKDSSEIIISIKKIEEGKKPIMIAKITEDYSKPIYFQKNFLNLAFIPTNQSYQYYYMDIFKGEEGEVLLNNKKYKGIMISKIIKKGENGCNILENSECYPKEDERYYSLQKQYSQDYLIYNEYSQKLAFNSSHTIKCNDGCYLLLTYYSIYLNANNSIPYILGTEFTLLSRVLNEEDIKPQIINSPLNEYISGTMDSFSSINMHYYSFFIPEDKNIVVEFHIKNIYILGKGGISSFKFNEEFILPERDFYDEEYIGYLTPNKFFINSFKAQYITIAFFRPNGYDSNYYFRILQPNSTDNYLIYPLDENKANYCKTMEINGNYSCFFYINNYCQDINELNQLVLYGYGKKRISYKAWLVKSSEKDYYSIDLKNITFNLLISGRREFFRIYNKSSVDYILIEIKSTSLENLTIIANYYDSFYFFPTINIYSYQIIYMYKKTTSFDFDYKLFDEYRIFINHTAGNGNFNFEKDNYKDITKLSDKNIISFFISKEINRFNVTTEGNLAFCIKIDYKYENNIIKEIKFDHDYKSVNNHFPLGFYIKENNNKGADINFYFKFNDINNTNKIIIKGDILNYDNIKMINSGEEIYLPWNVEIDGTYDERSNNGFIVFDEEKINKIYPISMDIYYFIYLYIDDDIEQNQNFSLSIHSCSKDNSEFSIPFNKYIYGSINLYENVNQNQKYYIKELDKSDKYIIEFSTNYENLELIFHNISVTKKEINGGIQKYHIKQNNTDFNSENYFEIKIKNDANKINKKELQKANYVLKYVKYDRETNESKIINKIIDVTFDFEEKNNILKVINKNEEYENLTDNYEISYILNIYDKIKKEESLNTIAPTYSESIYSNRTENPNKEEFYNLDFLLNHESYTTAFLFIKIQNKKTTELNYYYSYEYEFEKKTDNKNKLLLISLISVSIALVIIIFIFVVICRRFSKKSKNLKEQVQQLSFSSGIDEDILDKSKKKTKEDEDYEKTFI